MSWFEAPLSSDGVIFTLVISGADEEFSHIVEFPKSSDREDGNRFSLSWKSAGVEDLILPLILASRVALSESSALFSGSCFLGYLNSGGRSPIHVVVGIE